MWGQKREILLTSMLILVILIAGCTQNQESQVQQTKVCPGSGKIVGITDLCPQYWCGDGTCLIGNETCSSCSQDCGTCTQPPNSVFEAIERVAGNQTIANAIRQNVINYNCATRNLQLQNTVVEVSRVTFSQNLISCDIRNSFQLAELKNIASAKDLFSRIETCDKILIEDYNKVIRGYAISGMDLGDTCFDCDEIYAVHMGCNDADNKNNGFSALAIVDAKTGISYW